MTEEMNADQFWFLIAGIALVVLAALAWTGVWTWWARIPTFRPFPITWGLLLGLLFMFYGLNSFMSDDVVVTLGFLAIPTIILLIYCYFADPQWFRPKWYKNWDDRNIDPNFRGYAALAAMPAPVDLDSELAARNAHLHEEVLDRHGLCRLIGEEWGRPTKQHMNGVVEGAFLFYPSTLVFHADSSDDNLRLGPTVREIPAADIRSVERTIPDSADRRRGWRIRFSQLLIHTTHGPWRVEVLRPKALTTAIHRHYLRPDHDSGGDDVERGHRR